MHDAPGDDLYALPLAEFTDARNRLARALAKAGDKAAAEAVKRSRKPTVAAWALNQVARQDADAVHALLASGRRMRDQQQEMLRGRGGDLRSARETGEQEAANVASLAVKVLADAGHAVSDTTRTRMIETLRAAAVDEALGDQLRAGALVEDTQLIGFPIDLGDLAEADQQEGEEKDGGEGAQPRVSAPELRAARQRLSSLDDNLRRAEARVERTTEQLERARRRLDEYATEAREAEDALAALRDEHRAAGEALEALEAGEPS